MRGRAGLVVAALAFVGVLALATFPARAWRDQRANHRDLAAQESTLIAENRALQGRADQLQSDEEIERLARQYNLVKPGEESYFILPQATPPTTAAPAPPPEPEPKRSKSLLDRLADLF